MHALENGFGSISAAFGKLDIAHEPFPHTCVQVSSLVTLSPISMLDCLQLHQTYPCVITFLKNWREKNSTRWLCVLDCGVIVDGGG